MNYAHHRLHDKVTRRRRYKAIHQW